MGVERAGHALKGCVSNFGARAATRCAQALETLGREGRMSDARGQQAELEREVERLRTSLAALGAEMPV